MGLYDISGTGTQVRIVASKTLPIGANISHFAGDGSVFESTGDAIAEMSVGLNGDGISYDKPTMTKVKLIVIPNSPSDLTLQTILKMNTTTSSRASIGDVITIVKTDRSGTKVYAEGKMLNGPRDNGTDGKGKKSNSTYEFAFTSVY